MNNLVSVHQSNLVDLKDGQYYFGNVFTEEDKKRLKEEQPSENLVKEYEKTHLLVAYPGLSLLTLERLHPTIFSWCHDYLRYHDKNGGFAKREGKPAWYFIRKTEMPNSRGRLWKEQKRLLSDGIYVPNIGVITYTALSHYLKTGEKLFADCFVRTADSGDLPCQRIVFSFRYGGISIFPWDDSNSLSKVACASAVKLKRVH